MKKYLLYFFVLASFSILVKPVFPQDITNRWGTGFRYSYVLPDDDDFKTHGNAYNLNLSYGLNGFLALELESGYFRLKTVDGSILGVSSFLVNLQLRKQIKEWSPYLVGGVGFQNYHYDKLRLGDGKDKNFGNAYKAGFGLDYFLNKNWALNIESVYIYGNTGGRATLDTYGFHYSAGVKYYY